MSGCDNFDFEAPQDEFKFMDGLRGADGTTFYPHVSADGVLSWTNDGGKPNPAPVDISGPPGSSVELRGPVASVEDLPTSAPSGELWLVGTASPYDGWFYNGTRWENAGQIAIGPPGPVGEDGVSPVIAVTDIPGGHHVTITDASGTSSIDIMDGEPGPPGATPDLQIGTVETGEPGSAAEATITGTPTAPRLNLTLPRGQQGPSVPLSDATPLMDGTASPGTGTSAARSDHRHPTDTSRASAAAVLQAAVKTISANGTSSNTLAGLTANHVVGNWGMFSDAACTTPIPENAPTCDITITTAADAWSVTIANFSSTFYLRPTFILKQN